MGVNGQPRLTKQTLKVLGALIANPADQMSGSEIAAATKLPSGTLYPILLRLEGVGWLESHWEMEDPHLLGRPRRRLYRVTTLGAEQIDLAFREIRFALEGLACI